MIEVKVGNRAAQQGEIVPDGLVWTLKTPVGATEKVVIKGHTKGDSHVPFLLAD